MAFLRPILSAMGASITVNDAPIEGEGAEGEAMRAAKPIGSPTSYILNGAKIEQPIQIWIRDDPTTLKKKKIASKDFQKAVDAASSTWNDAAGRTLFLPAKVGTPVSGERDGASVILFGAGKPPWLAYCVRWNNGEADIVLSTDLAWTADARQTNRGLYLRTVALHELGHFAGLGDLYSLPAGDPKRNDKAQIMNSYKVQTALGAGDIAGIKKLYGE